VAEEVVRGPPPRTVRTVPPARTGLRGPTGHLATYRDGRSEPERQPEPPVSTVACPVCGEDEDLTGQRDGEAIVLTCGGCGHRWDRATRPTCRRCGSTDVEGIPTSTIEEAGRGEQRTPSGIRLVHYCWDCRGDDVTSTTPRPGPNPPPGRSTDLRALRGRSRDR
jgi:hypothetical protein